MRLMGVDEVDGVDGDLSTSSTLINPISTPAYIAFFFPLLMPMSTPRKKKMRTICHGRPSPSMVICFNYLEGCRGGRKIFNFSKNHPS
jgi:hypothetical protein